MAAMAGYYGPSPEYVNGVEQMRRAARVDGNHHEITQALRRVGCRVMSLAALGSGCPDLLVRLPGHGDLMLMEVKSTRGKMNAAQRAFEGEGWPVFVVRSVDEALKLVMG